MRSAQSPWRIKLVREITLILLIKLAILLGIKAIWFDAPTLPENGSARVEARFFAVPAPAQPRPSATQEASR